MTRNYRHEYTIKIKLADEPVIGVDLEALKEKLIKSGSVQLAGAAGVVSVDEAYVVGVGTGTGEYLHVGGLVQSLSTLSEVPAKIGRGFQDYIGKEISLDASASVVVEVEVSTTMVEVNRKSAKIHPPNSAIATVEGFKAEIEKRLSGQREDGKPDITLVDLTIDMFDLCGSRRKCLIMRWDTGRIDVYVPTRVDPSEDDDGAYLTMTRLQPHLLERNYAAAHELGIIDQLTLLRLNHIKSEQEREQRAAMLRRELEAIEGKKY